jgi:hypothetical protein
MDSSTSNGTNCDPFAPPNTNHNFDPPLCIISNMWLGWTHAFMSTTLICLIQFDLPMPCEDYATRVGKKIKMVSNFGFFYYKLA